VYHLSDQALLLTRFFKLLRFESVKTYLKLDANDNLFNYKLFGLRGRIRKYFLRNIDLITVENKRYQHRLNTEDLFGRTVDYCPNGFHDFGHRAAVSFDQKDNYMITVGRLGTPPKATDTLLEGFRLFAKSDSSWKLEVVGPVEPAFQEYISRYFIKNPELKERVHFTGGITDRVVLSEKYNRAKIFVLSSRWEGFPLVYTEAMRAGCFIISSNIPAASDVIHNQYGLQFPIDDTVALAKVMLTAVSDQSLLAEACHGIQKHAYATFYWPEICRNLHFLLS